MTGFSAPCGAPVSMLVVFAVTALVQWPTALILLVGSLVVPPNMCLAGLSAAEAKQQQVATGTRLGAVVLDSFRGLRTLLRRVTAAVSGGSTRG